MPKSTTTPLEQTARLLDLVPFLLSHQGISILTLKLCSTISTLCGCAVFPDTHLSN